MRKQFPKIVTTIQDFKKVVLEFDAVLRCEAMSSELHFYAKDGRIIEYHLPRCNEVRDKRYIKPFHATHEPVNYYA